jgi:nitrous oxidase accessory protein NosD
MKKMEKELQEKFVSAKEGEVIELPEGTFTLNRPLILDGVKNVTIKGKGKGQNNFIFQRAERRC